MSKFSWLWSKKKTNDKFCLDTVDAHGKVVLITGANSGIGKATASGLARKGATLVLACRSMERAEEAAAAVRQEVADVVVDCLQLDLSSCQSVCDFAACFALLHASLDVLILNAGVMCCPRSETREGFELQLGVNHLGHMLLTALLLPQLKQAASSRILVVSSYGQKFGRMRWEDLCWRTGYSPLKAYLQSKLANVLFMRALHRRLQGSGVTVNALHPGVVRTALGRHLYSSLGWLQASIITLLCQPSIVSPAKGCASSLFCALAPHLQGVSGLYFSDRCTEESLSKNASDAEAERLWAASVELLADFLPAEFAQLAVTDP